MRALAKFALGPLWQGILLVALFYVVPYLDIFAIVVQCFITLRQGMTKGLIVTLAGALLGITSGFLITSLFAEVEYNLLVDSMQWALILSIPLWGFSGLLRKTVSLSFTTQVMTLSFMAIFAFNFYNQVSLFPESLQGPISENVTKFTEVLVKTQNELAKQYDDSSVVITPEKVELINNFLTYLFEIVTVYSMYLTLLLLARMWQSHIFMPKGFLKEFVNLRSGALITSILVFTWLWEITMASGMLAYSLGGILFIGFTWLFLTGLAYIHWLISTYNLSWGFTIFFYVLLLMPVLSSIVLLLLILIGLSDGFVDLRAVTKRVKGDGQ